jgi:hypothetical protein
MQFTYLIVSNRVTVLVSSATYIWMKFFKGMTHNFFLQFYSIIIILVTYKIAF